MIFSIWPEKTNTHNCVTSRTQFGSRVLVRTQISFSLQRPGNAQIWRAADRAEVRAVLANLARLARDR
jgi:hypothetical protein